MGKRQVSVVIASCRDGRVQITAEPVGEKFTHEEVDRLCGESKWLDKLNKLPEVAGRAYCSATDNHAKASYSGKGTIENFEKFVLAILGEVFEITSMNRFKD